MFSERERFISHVMKIFDFLTLLLAFFVAYFLDEFIRIAAQMSIKAYAMGPTYSGFWFFASNYWMMFLGFPIIWISMFSINGIYKDFRTRSIKKLIWLLFVSGVWGTLASGSLLFLTKEEWASRLFFAVFAACALGLLLIEKLIVLKTLDFIQKNGHNQENLLIVGTGSRARDFIRTVNRHSNWGFRIVGLIDDEHGLFGKEIEGYRVIGKIQDIPFIVNRIVIDRVIFVVPRQWLHRIEDAILACENVGVPTSISLDLYNLHISRTRQTDFNGFPLLEFETFYAKEWQLFIKRVVDMATASIALVVFSPLMFLVALGIKLTSKGPVFFKQIRCGLNGRKFTLYKFRSMVIDAEDQKKDLLKKNEMDGPVFKIKNDPRITKIGNFIRKTSIDELPQFFNVLKGDMSIVGPRPPLETELEDYELWQRRRLSLKPGITCIWQVSGRNKISFDQWMKMDLEYIDNWSLWLDFKIQFKTLFVVLVGYGAS